MEVTAIILGIGAIAIVFFVMWAWLSLRSSSGSHLFKETVVIGNKTRTSHITFDHHGSNESVIPASRKRLTRDEILRKLTQNKVRYKNAKLAKLQKANIFAGAKRLSQIDISKFDLQDSEYTQATSNLDSTTTESSQTSTSVDLEIGNLKSFLA